MLRPGANPRPEFCLTEHPTQAAARENGSGACDQEQTAALQHTNHRYPLSSADVLELIFPFTLKFNQIVNGLPDGCVTYVARFLPIA